MVVGKPPTPKPRPLNLGVLGELAAEQKSFFWRAPREGSARARAAAANVRPPRAAALLDVVERVWGGLSSTIGISFSQ